MCFWWAVPPPHTSGEKYRESSIPGGAAVTGAGQGSPGLEGGPLLFELLQVDRVCTRLFTGINVPGKHTEMKHLVFKSVLGARQNEEPLIKARHVISTHVTQSRPRPPASPSPRPAGEKRSFKTLWSQTPGAGFIHKAPSLGSARSGCQKCLNMEKNKQLQHVFRRDLSEALCDVMGNAAFVLPAGK